MDTPAIDKLIALIRKHATTAHISRKAELELVNQVERERNELVAAIKEEQHVSNH